MATRIGIDVGGTFTDLIVLDEESGEITVGKGPSNPAAVDQAVQGVLASTVDRSVVERAGYFLHGTSRNPSVVSRPTRAPLRSRRALSPTVVPCRK